jgi:hypothetical protein
MVNRECEVENEDLAYFPLNIFLRIVNTLTIWVFCVEKMTALQRLKELINLRL